MSVPFQLVGTSLNLTIEVGEGPPRIVGRSAGADVPVYDPTLSRDHAELALGEEGVRVRDLGSTNGTFLNGERIQEGLAEEGDTVTFGGVSFKVQRPAPEAEAGDSEATAGEPEGEAAGEAEGKPAAEKVRRKLPVQEADPSGAQPAQGADAGGGSRLLKLADLAGGRVAAKLSVLLELSKALSRERSLDQLLERIVERAFSILELDRACLMVVEGETLELVPRVVKGDGEEEGEGVAFVPRSVAYQAVAEQAAILSDNLAEDERFEADSVRMQGARSSLCIPMVGNEGEALGVLYLDKAEAGAFTDEDLEFMTAFGSIAAIAVENRRLVERSEREAARLRQLGERFAPSLPGAVGAEEGEIVQSGARQELTVLVSRLAGLNRRASRQPAERTAGILEGYYQRLLAVVVEYGGTLQCVSGETAVAVWGARARRPDDAELALRAGQELVASGGGGGHPAVGIAFGQGFVGGVGGRQGLALAGEVLDAAAALAERAGEGGLVVSEAFYRCLESPPRGQPAGGGAYRIAGS